MFRDVDSTNLSIACEALEWYQWAYYWDEIEKEKKLCRWLGVASTVGQAMGNT